MPIFVLDSTCLCAAYGYVVCVCMSRYIFMCMVCARVYGSMYLCGIALHMCVCMH